MHQVPWPRIHPTALISQEAQLAEDVVVGPFVVIEGPVRLGPGCIVRPHAHLIGPLTMGSNNQVFSGAVLGERPQHLKYNGEPTSLEIGAHNVFRENVTVHRGTTQSWTTRIGSHNFFMAGAHVAHDCVIGNRCILANNALVGGHAVLEDSVYLSGNSAIHQFCRVGRLALLGGCSGSAKDVPPFVIQQNIDSVLAVNVIGMRRAGMTSEQINGVRQAFKIIFRQGLLIPTALAKIEESLADNDAVAEMVAFIRKSTRGISPMRDRNRTAA